MGTPAVPEPVRWSVEESYAYCQALARARYENFPVASRAVPRSIRPHVCAIYAFARAADDFADEAPHEGRRLEELDGWEARLDACAEGRADHPVFVALAKPVYWLTGDAQLGPQLAAIAGAVAAVGLLGLLAVRLGATRREGWCAAAVLAALPGFLFNANWDPVQEDFGALVPIFGSILSTLPIVFVALSSGLTTALAALSWIVGIHVLEANLLNPKIMGDAAKIHPVLVVLALVVGEHFAGIVGALLAVPLMSILVTIFKAARTRAMQLDEEIAAQGDAMDRASAAAPAPARVRLRGEHASP